MRQSHLSTAAILAFPTCLLWPPPQGIAAENPQVRDGSSVTILYLVTVPGTAGVGFRDISQFVQGQHQILPALERELTGMMAGEEKRVELSAEQGFGAYDEKKKRTLPKTELPEGVKEGDILKDRAGTPAIVAQLSDTSAVLDYNHPLAGKPLLVKIIVLKVENPS